MFVLAGGGDREDDTARRVETTRPCPRVGTTDGAIREYGAEAGATEDTTGMTCKELLCDFDSYVFSRGSCSSPRAFPIILRSPEWLSIL